ncbi:Hypothetical Protein FCC1311_100282 [Hondaea fermentalgiana]|uniref:Uncharacterized protein n=1 Tax=Hondaea fermentalgiana TaxID=2315210 RepID=A0A2R5GT96_9STRA|nr:Hypothetical Protein FCC1311_100282 [Hondaea fermentalgiana]|eukprot:GBG33805.1 Hypothetical Protein FCC1311_100282 [Hondaea fermentalgiana]
MPELVVIDYEALVDKDRDVKALIEEAYGADGLGVLAIRNVPGFVEARDAALPQGHALAHAGDKVLDSLVDVESMYQAGWSRGKEKIGDKPDLAKASFFFNPLVDVPGTAEDRAKWPLSYPCNVWPSEEDLPGFENSLKSVGRIMRQTTAAVGKRIDELAATQLPNYNLDLGKLIAETDKAKGRLLYYYPLTDEEKSRGQRDSWIGVHNDSGFLTALAGEIYLDDEGNTIENPDPAAGLYVIDRAGVEHHVVIPKDCMAVQIGECVQVITGSVVQATPHYVRGAVVEGRRVARVSLPVFIDTKPDFALTSPEGITRQTVVDSASKEVPALGVRWLEQGQTFGDFLMKSVDVYYSWNQELSKQAFSDVSPPVSA